MIKAGVYVRVGHIGIVDRAHLAVLAMLPPLFVGMHYERVPRVSCLLKLSCVQCTASQFRASRDSVSARLINVERAQVSCNS